MTSSGCNVWSFSELERWILSRLPYVVYFQSYLVSFILFGDGLPYIYVYVYIYKILNAKSTSRGEEEKKNVKKSHQYKYLYGWQLIFLYGKGESGISLVDFFIISRRVQNCVWPVFFLCKGIVPKIIWSHEELPVLNAAFLGGFFKSGFLINKYH